MTDRINALTVILDRDIRDDDVQGLVDAILRLRNVASVRKHISNCLDDAVATARVKAELSRKLFAVLHDSDEGRKP